MRHRFVISGTTHALERGAGTPYARIILLTFHAFNKGKQQQRTTSHDNSDWIYGYLFGGNP